MTEARRTCAILGASGYIGQHFARILANHPWFEPPRLIVSARHAGRRLEELWQLSEDPPSELAEVRCESIGPAGLARAGVAFAFGALPSGTAGTFETELSRRGTAVFSNSSDHRMDPGVPLLIPEVNGAHLSLIRTTGGPAPIVTNPNCTATGLVLGLAPLLSLLRPRWLNLATYQALSGAGYPGVASLSVTDNVIPYIPEEEEKVSAEANRILGTIRNRRVAPAHLQLLVQCARVGVRDGHLEAVTICASRRPTLKALVAAIENFDPLRELDLPMAPHPPVRLRTEVDRPQPLRDRWAGDPPRARGMTVTIGRLRWEPPYLRCFLLSHNAVRGGAGGSVLNAEFAIARGLAKGSEEATRA